MVVMVRIFHGVLEGDGNDDEDDKEQCGWSRG